MASTYVWRSANSKRLSKVDIHVLIWPDTSYTIKIVLKWLAASNMSRYLLITKMHHCYYGQLPTRSLPYCDEALNGHLPSSFYLSELEYLLVPNHTLHLSTYIFLWLLVLCALSTTLHHSWAPMLPECLCMLRSLKAQVPEIAISTMPITHMLMEWTQGI